MSVKVQWHDTAIKVLHRDREHLSRHFYDRLEITAKSLSNHTANLRSKSRIESYIKQTAQLPPPRICLVVDDSTRAAKQ